MEYRQWNEVDDYAEARKWAAPKLISASHVLVRDMLFDQDIMNFDEFMRNRFIPEIAIQRRSGYLRLRLRTSKFDHRQNLIFIKKDYQDFDYCGFPNMDHDGGGHGGKCVTGTVSKFVEDYQDFDHRGFPNMGHGGGGPHGGASRGGGRHGGNFRRSGDSSRSGATHPFNSGGVSRGCGGKFYGGRQGYGTSGHCLRQ
ncbi:hypothetical protein Tco_1008631, partial [Tanacetum coccineum]